MAGAARNLSQYDPIYFGIKPEAKEEWLRLQEAQDREQFYPCRNNPYFYMDYDGFGLEREDGQPGGRVPLTQEDADALCAGCPLIKQCYDFAVANDEQFGVWGGILFGVDDKLF